MNHRHIGLYLGILIMVVFWLLPLPDGLSPEGKLAAGVTLLMACWWITEAIPICATAFVPLLLFPVFGVLDGKSTAANFGESLVLLLICALVVAKAVESSGLHRRVALGTIRAIGTSRKKILFSCMVATAGLSMWLSNLAVSLMMFPIGMALIRQDDGHEQGPFSNALLLGIAYSASIGGIGTLIGTTSNLIFAGIFRNLYPEAPEISFAKWMMFGCPLVALFIPLCWYHLVLFFKVGGKLPHSGEWVEQEWIALGRMTKAEKRTMFVCLIMVFGWVFRNDMVIGSFSLPGWSSLLGLTGFVDDGTVAALGMLLLFLIPSGESAMGKRVMAPRLMDWETAKTIPWGVAMIVGGGYCIASGFQETGLSEWISGHLGFISNFSTLFVVLACVLLLSFLTEINSNTATATIFLPVLGTIAVAGHTDPLLLMIPGTVACSCAFMMPAGTGPNSVIFASGLISIPTMAKCGFWLNMIGVVLITLVVYLIAIPVFGILHEVPLWAR